MHTRAGVSTRTHMGVCPQVSARPSSSDLESLGKYGTLGFAECLYQLFMTDQSRQVLSKGNTEGDSGNQTPI
jgi:hypothetical protein